MFPRRPGSHLEHRSNVVYSPTFVPERSLVAEAGGDVLVHLTLTQTLTLTVAD